MVLPSREVLPEHWSWDVFVCHAGEDKPFARELRKRLQEFDLTCFVDEDDLRVGDHAPLAMAAAVRTTHIAVILLCKEFFCKTAPQQELRDFLLGLGASRNHIVPVFMGISLEECEEMARRAGLAEVCKITGVRHAHERRRWLMNWPLHKEKTLQRIVREVCRLARRAP